MRTSSRNRIVARVEANGVEFQQQQTPTGGIHTSTSSHTHGVYTWLHKEGMKTQTIVHHTVSVEAHEYELLTDSGDIVTRIDLTTATGGENTISFFGVTATQLIEALEAARMANTPEALLESAQ